LREKERFAVLRGDANRQRDLVDLLALVLLRSARLSGSTGALPAANQNLVEVIIARFLDSFRWRHRRLVDVES
jgi:hypothetical protein